MSTGKLNHRYIVLNLMACTPSSNDKLKCPFSPNVFYLFFRYFYAPQYRRSFKAYDKIQECWLKDIDITKDITPYCNSVIRLACNASPSVLGRLLGCSTRRSGAHTQAFLNCTLNCFLEAWSFFG